MTLATHCAYCTAAMPQRRAVYHYRNGYFGEEMPIPPECNPPPEREMRPVDPDDWKPGEWRRRIAYAPIVRHQYGAFCTYRCAVQFANAAHRAGYRITREAP